MSVGIQIGRLVDDQTGVMSGQMTGGIFEIHLGLEQSVRFVEFEKVLVLSLDKPGVLGVFDANGVDIGVQHDQRRLLLAADDLYLHGLVVDKEHILAAVEVERKRLGVDVTIRVCLTGTGSYSGGCGGDIVRSSRRRIQLFPNQLV